ncbi:MAG: response regulator [Burkholderiales bacterium]|nr:response regulator [Opitutaceae bacterium]
MRILYVEDNPLDAALASRELARATPSHQVEVAPSLAAAWLTLARPEPFDLALVDLDLPDGTGIEFVIGVRSRGLPLPLVMLTGSGDERSAVAALKAGADDYLVKTNDYLRQLPHVMESARAAFRSGLARRTRPLRVLYAEHNAADVDIVRRHLSRHAPHLTLDSVDGGEDVVARLAEHSSAYDVLLLDYRLRGLDAIETMRLLQERGLMSLPVVLVTGQGDEAVAVRALRLGAADYLVKRPGYLHELAATLENTHHRALLWREQVALAASEERFRQLAENIEEVFWISLPDGVSLLYASPAYEKVWGRSSALLIAHPADWMNAVWAEDQESVRAWLRAAAAGEGTRHVEYRIVRADGAVRWIRDRASPVRNAEGVVYRLVGVAEDITERRHLEEQFRQSQKMEAIGQLSGGVAHDFNNLLTIIHGHLGLLEASGHVTPEIASSIEQISQAATRASNLTRQLLTFSRKQVMRSRDLDLRTVVADLTKMLQRILGEDVEMVVNGGERPLWVHADPGMMEQILMNLTVNARDAMPRGGRLSINLESVGLAAVQSAEVDMDEPPAPAAAGAGYVRLTVSDTGTGIAPEVMTKIFEPFFTTKEVGKGTGLGLATVYGIVRQHCGGIKAVSPPGCGATFEVYLPQVASPGALLPVDDRRAARAPEPTRHSPDETILLVEDEPSVSAMVSLTLEWSGYRVLVASNGPEALEMWARERDNIDLLLTDLVMPHGISGRDLAQRLLADEPTLPVIYMSGYSAEIAGRDLGDLTAVKFLAKPFNVEELRQMVRSCL